MNHFKQSSTKQRNFSTSTPLQIDPQNGYELDRTKDIAKNFQNNTEEIENYFATKEQSIKDSYRNDSNRGAAEGVDAQELHQWMKDRDALLRELPGQKDDVLDLLLDWEDSDNDDSNSDNNSDSNTDSDSNSDNHNSDNDDTDHNMDSEGGNEQGPISEHDASSVDTSESEASSEESSMDISDNQNDGDANNVENNVNTFLQINNLSKVKPADTNIGGFKQDSSDIYKTDFTAYEDFDE